MTEPLWISIGAEGCVNFGNRLIEHAIEQTLEIAGRRVPLWSLKREWPGPAELTPVIIPGSTVMNLEPLLHFLDTLPDTVPVIMIGGCFWNEEPSDLALKIWRRSNMLLGVRDPYTHRTLRHNRIKSHMIGCPTMCWNEPGEYEPEHRVVLSFGRTGLPKSFWANAQDSCGPWSHWAILLHEEGDAKYIPASYTGDVIYLSQLSSSEAFLLYQRAALVITGRLHGLLPSLGRTHVVYYGDPTDTRNSLVKHLDVEVMQLGHVLDRRDPLARFSENARPLRQKYLDFLDLVRTITAAPHQKL